MNAIDALRTAGVVGDGAQGSSYEEVVNDAVRLGELRGAPVPMELPEDVTYAWLLEPLLKAADLSARWRITRHGFGSTPDTLYSEADGVVELVSIDGSRLQERADPQWGGRWYDHRVVERVLTALSSELDGGRAFYAIGRALSPEHPDFPSEYYVWTVLDSEGVRLLEKAGIDVRRVGGRDDGRAP